MPVYTYQVKEGEQGCVHCRDGFEVRQSMKDKALSVCTFCGVAVTRVITPVAIVGSKSNLDRRAKDSGFHKLRKVDKGTYEKEY